VGVEFESNLLKPRLSTFLGRVINNIFSLRGSAKVCVCQGSINRPLLHYPGLECKDYFMVILTCNRGCAMGILLR
jgi:hypothetical protein